MAATMHTGLQGGTWEGPLARPSRPALRLVTPPPSRRVPAGVYRRRRLVALVVLATVLTVAAFAASRALTASASAGAAPAAAVRLVAQPGDSYWSLAGEVHDGGDIRSTVDALVRANGGRELRAGDVITLVP